MTISRLYICCCSSCYPLYFGCCHHRHQFLRTWSIPQELKADQCLFVCVICKFEDYFALTSHFPSTVIDGMLECLMRFRLPGFFMYPSQSMCISGCRSLWRRWKTSLQSPPASRFTKDPGLGPFPLEFQTSSPKNRFSIHLFSIKFSRGFASTRTMAQDAHFSSQFDMIGFLQTPSLIFEAVTFSMLSLLRQRRRREKHRGCELSLCTAPERLLGVTGDLWGMDIPDNLLTQGQWAGASYFVYLYLTRWHEHICRQYMDLDYRLRETERGTP